MRIFFSVIAMMVAIIGLTVLGGSYYTVHSNERGVVIRNGRILGMADAGLGLKTPWVEEVRKIYIGVNTPTWDKIQAYSKDQQPADLKASINYSVISDQAACIYQNYGDDREILFNAVVAPRVQNNVKNIFGTYDAATAINSGAKLTADIAASIEASVSAVQPCGKPIITVSGFNLENVDFSDAYEHSVEDRMIAQIQVAKAEQNAAKANAEANQAVNEARGRADSVKLEADAEAHAIQVKGDAAAEVIASRGKALKDNPGIAALAIAERWDGKLPTSMIPGSAVPLMNITPPALPVETR